ncbi:hypothetical protein DNTS_031296 [Danionella cerebrum]|uniref:Uncharacterized protein n=1 Tax=Danionella cerebrum TaxID=2873325 RepID=A0A553Q615_9TELE|nr:hypothetical protein DNTS_031296 [Danionella translucida]
MQNLQLCSFGRGSFTSSFRLPLDSSAHAQHPNACMTPSADFPCDFPLSRAQLQNRRSDPVLQERPEKLQSSSREAPEQFQRTQ